jgi:hypothetical protein
MNTTIWADTTQLTLLLHEFLLLCIHPTFILLFNYIFMKNSLLKLFKLLNPLVPELSIQCTPQKTRDLNGRPLLCISLANDLRRGWGFLSITMYITKATLGTKGLMCMLWPICPKHHKPCTDSSFVCWWSIHPKSHVPSNDGLWECLRSLCPKLHMPGTDGPWVRLRSFYPAHYMPTCLALLFH